MSDINPNTMNRDELESTAGDLGLSYAHNISDDKLRVKIAEALGDAGSTTTAPETEQPKKATQEKRFEIIIATHDQDKQPVPVGVNGKTYLIQRGKRVEVPESVVKVLESAVQFQYDPKTMERTEVLSYPFQVMREV